MKLQVSHSFNPGFFRLSAALDSRSRPATPGLSGMTVYTNCDPVWFTGVTIYWNATNSRENRFSSPIESLKAGRPGCAVPQNERNCRIGGVA